MMPFQTENFTSTSTPFRTTLCACSGSSCRAELKSSGSSSWDEDTCPSKRIYTLRLPDQQRTKSSYLALINIFVSVSAFLWTILATNDISRIIETVKRRDHFHSSFTASHHFSFRHRGEYPPGRRRKILRRHGTALGTLAFRRAFWEDRLIWIDEEGGRKIDIEVKKR